uniref:Potassium channel domain-containing protein n=1 Tax=Romanomermis culicivorax TaxID=13658 RepID=A0A915IHM5_ROMCU
AFRSALSFSSSNSFRRSSRHNENSALPSTSYYCRKSSLVTKSSENLKIDFNDDNVSTGDNATTIIDIVSAVGEKHPTIIGATSVPMPKRQTLVGVSKQKEKLTQSRSFMFKHRTNNSNNNNSYPYRRKRISDIALNSRNFHHHHQQQHHFHHVHGYHNSCSFSTNNENNFDADNLLFDEELSAFRESMEEKLERANVPIFIVLLVMMGYLCSGGLLFSVWEKWDFLDAFYFCFCNLATIGFGDMFPGASLVNDRHAQQKLMITSFYLLFGMALIAMCFNLAQEQVVTKMTELAVRFGMVKLESFSSMMMIEDESAALQLHRTHSKRRRTYGTIEIGQLLHSLIAPFVPVAVLGSTWKKDPY